MKKRWSVPSRHYITLTDEIIQLYAKEL